MDNERRDPRDWPETDSESDATRPEAPPEAPQGGGWPAEDVSQAPPPEPVWSAPVEPTETQSWPTEPPAAGSAGDEAWPTSAPERGSELGAEREEVGWPTGSDQDAPGTQGAQPSWPEDPRLQAMADMPVEDPAAARPPEAVEAYPAAAPAHEDRLTEPPPAETEADMVAVPQPSTDATAATAAHGVPDAQGAVGESTQCPRCGTENRPGLSFCRNCGQRLVAAGVATTVERPGAPEGTQACPRCGTHNRSGTAFCQNCGANLRGTSAGYVPPAVAQEPAGSVVTEQRRGAVLGPIVLLIGLVGLVTGYLLPFIGGDSLYDGAFGPGGYGAAFWNGYPEVEAGIADQAYFGLAAPVPLLALLLAGLAAAGFARARPTGLQTVGLVVALIWSVGLIVLFLLVELAGGLGGDIVGILRGLTPAGIILFLASLIVLIGALTRFGRS